MASATILVHVPAGFRVEVRFGRQKNGLIHGYPDSTYRALLSLHPHPSARRSRTEKIPFACAPLFEGRYRLEVHWDDSEQILASSGNLYKQDPWGD